MKGEGGGSGHRWHAKPSGIPAHVLGPGGGFVSFVRRPSVRCVQVGSVGASHASHCEGGGGGGALLVPIFWGDVGSMGNGVYKREKGTLSDRRRIVAIVRPGERRKQFAGFLFRALWYTITMLFRYAFMLEYVLSLSLSLSLSLFTTLLGLRRFFVVRLEWWSWEGLWGVPAWPSSGH